MRNQKTPSIFKVTGGLLAISIICSIAVMIICCVLFVKGCNKVNDEGLKNVINEVWEGPDKASPANEN